MKTKYRKKAFRLLLAESEYLTVQVAAEQCGLMLSVSFMRGRPKSPAIPHWQFRFADGSILLHWWPSKGSYWAPVGNRKGKCNDPHLVLVLARYLIGEVDTNTADELREAGVIR